MANLTTQLIVRVLDQASAPARAIAASLRGITAAANSVGGRMDASIAGMRAAIERNNAAMDAARGRMLDAVAGFYALQGAIRGPVEAASAFETTMEDISQKAELSKEGVAKLRTEILGLSQSVGASANQVGKGFDYLLGQGMKVTEASKIMPAIMKTAVAYRATIEDVSKAGFAALDNLKVPAEQFEVALNMMARAGKEGAFELRDMASEFPSLTAAASALEMKGTTAVARLAAVLQIARKGAGTSAEAANNVANLMQKIISPETTKKFQKLGIDIRKELKKTQAAGGDVFEMIAVQVNKALKGDLSKLGDIFEDRQVQQAIRPLIQQLEEYKRIRKEAMNPGDIISGDYASRMKTFEAANNKFRASLERLGIALGTALFPQLTAMMDKIAPLIEKVTQFANANPELAASLMTVVKAVVAVRIAMIAGSFAAGLFRGGILAVGVAALTAARGVWKFVAAIGAMTLGSALAAVARLRFALVGLLALFSVGGWTAAITALGGAFLALLNPLRLVGAAFVALRVAMMASGIGLVIGAIAAAGLAIYNNWSGLGEMFAAFGKRIAEAFPGVGDMIQKVAGYAKALWDAVSGLAGPIDESGAKWREFGTAAADAIVGAISKVGEFVSYLAALPGRIKAALGNAATLLYDWGAQLIQGLIDGIKNKVSELLGYVSGIGSRIKGALGGGVRVEGSLSDGGPISGARAMGGPVSRGNNYLVGEKGPEIFTANRSGTIIPNGAGGGGGNTISVEFNPTIHVSGGDAEDTAKKVRDQLDSMARDALRSVFADAGLRTA